MSFLPEPLQRKGWRLLKDKEISMFIYLESLQSASSDTHFTGLVFSNGSALGRNNNNNKETYRL